MHCLGVFFLIDVLIRLKMFSNICPRILASAGERSRFISTSPRSIYSCLWLFRISEPATGDFNISLELGLLFFAASLGSSLFGIHSSQTDLWDTSRIAYCLLCVAPHYFLDSGWGMKEGPFPDSRIQVHDGTLDLELKARSCPRIHIHPDLPIGVASTKYDLFGKDKHSNKVGVK